MVTTIRLPDELHKRLKKEAEKRGCENVEKNKKQ